MATELVPIPECSKETYSVYCDPERNRRMRSLLAQVDPRPTKILQEAIDLLYEKRCVKCSQ